MKTRIGFCLAVIISVTLLSCAQVKEKSADELLENKTTQNEIMEAISNDHEMMTNMMNHIRQSDHAMQMMSGDTTMTRYMMQGNQMMNMMKGNPEMMSTMMQHMMNVAASDTTACRTMGNMMMGNEHMKSMMQDMMSKKGMMMGERKSQQMHMEKHQ